MIAGLLWPKSNEIKVDVCIYRLSQIVVSEVAEEQESQDELQEIQTSP